MRDGWRCPVCNKGLSPDERTCDHGGGYGHRGTWTGPVAGGGSGGTGGVVYHVPETRTVVVKAWGNGGPGAFQGY